MHKKRKFVYKLPYFLLECLFIYIEDYIIERECLVNKFISVPKDKGTLNCASFVAGIVEGILCTSGFVRISSHEIFLENYTQF